MTTKTRYSITAPDGSVHTRTSARAYTHAVLGGKTAKYKRDDAIHTLEVIAGWVLGGARADLYESRRAECQAEVDRYAETPDSEIVSWGVYSWNGTEALAEKSAATWRRNGMFGYLAVVPVTAA